MYEIRLLNAAGDVVLTVPHVALDDIAAWIAGAREFGLRCRAYSLA